MLHRWTRAIALVTMITVGTASCGYVFHPERRGNNGGILDGTTLVLDCLWLLAGVVPGVVFLIVDFASGAMYVNGRVAMKASPDGNIAINLKDQQTARQLELRIVTAHGTIDAKTTQVGPSVHGQSVALHVGTVHEPLFLQIRDGVNPPVQMPIEVL